MTEHQRDELHAQMIHLNRLLRLIRIKRYRQDGKGNALSPEAERLVDVAIEDAHYHATYFGAGVIADIAMGERR